MNDSTASPDEKIEGVRSIYDQLGVKKIALDAMEMYYQKALEHLALVSVSDSRKSILLQLAKDLMNRKE